MPDAASRRNFRTSAFRRESRAEAGETTPRDLPRWSLLGKYAGASSAVSSSPFPARTSRPARRKIYSAGPSDDAATGLPRHRGPNSSMAFRGRDFRVSRARTNDFPSVLEAARKCVRDADDSRTVLSLFPRGKKGTLSSLAPSMTQTRSPRNYFKHSSIISPALSSGPPLSARTFVSATH